MPILRCGGFILIVDYIYVTRVICHDFERKMSVDANSDGSSAVSVLGNFRRKVRFDLLAYWFIRSADSVNNNRDGRFRKYSSARRNFRFPSRVFRPGVI